MRNAEVRRVDREIRQTEKKLEALRRGESWPLNRRERRVMAGGSRAGDRMGSLVSVADTRLTAELIALHGERQRLVTETSRAKTSAKTSKKSSGWW
ncbi:hypothetical protein [Streptomyces sp. NPDC059142]|uniref:hypothetical protein n=1 Tax=Streptomyces sp. NPDC059142 TaxID=3346739 RepID=UPI0036C53A23